jgi:N-acetylmuramoyl-L-alanine amidase
VSIHINSCKIPNRASGSSTYYHKADSSSRALAQSVLGRIARVSGLPSLGAMSDRTLYANGLAVLRHSAVPATLVEVAFLNHAGDRKLLRTEEFRNRIARAIAEGIKGYFDASLPDAPAAESAEALLQTR